MDGQNVRGPVIPQDRHGERYKRRQRCHREDEFTWPQRTTVDVENMAKVAFARINEIHYHCTNEGDKAAMGEPEGQFDKANLEHMIRESTETVYEGSTLNHLQCAIVLFSHCALYSVPQTFLDALLTWIAGDLLPTSNKFPRIAYEVKSLLTKLGLKHEQVHCCLDRHVLYQGVNEQLQECPTCQQQRYIPGSNNVPQRVARYFDVIKHAQFLNKMIFLGAAVI